MQSCFWLHKSRHCVDHVMVGIIAGDCIFQWRIHHHGPCTLHSFWLRCGPMSCNCALSHWLFIHQMCLHSGRNESNTYKSNQGSSNSPDLHSLLVDHCFSHAILEPISKCIQGNRLWIYKCFFTVPSWRGQCTSATTDYVTLLKVEMNFVSRGKPCTGIQKRIPRVFRE